MKHILRRYTVLLFITLLARCVAIAQIPVMSWDFEWVEGVAGKELCLDGIATRVIRHGYAVRKVSWNTGTNGTAQDSVLSKGFVDPGNTARPKAYWNWLNGDVQLNSLTNDLEEAKAKGLGGLLMWDTEAMLVEGSGRIKHELPFPEIPAECPKGEDGLPKWYIDVAVLAWPDSEDKVIKDLSKVINLTENFKDGELRWTPPAGKWQVVRYVCTNNGQQLIAASPNSKGPFIDFLDPEATRFHFKYIIEKLGIKKRGNPEVPLKTLDAESWTTWWRWKDGPFVRKQYVDRAEES